MRPSGGVPLGRARRSEEFAPERHHRWWYPVRADEPPVEFARDVVGQVGAVDDDVGLVDGQHRVPVRAPPGRQIAVRVDGTIVGARLRCRRATFRASLVPVGCRPQSGCQTALYSTSKSAPSTGQPSRQRRSPGSPSRQSGHPVRGLYSWDGPAALSGSPAARKTRWSSANSNPKSRSMRANSASVSPGPISHPPISATRRAASSPSHLAAPLITQER